jgi:hypothetical protein
MRIIHQAREFEDPVFREVVVAVPVDDVPSVGSRIDLDGIPFRVDAVYRWYEAFSDVLDYGESAFELKVRRDDPGTVGSPEHPRPHPPRLSGGATAESPTAEARIDPIAGEQGGIGPAVDSAPDEGEPA